MAEVKLKTKKKFYGIEKKPGDIIQVREDVAIRWAKKEICEYPIKPETPRTKEVVKTDD